MGLKNSHYNKNKLTQEGLSCQTVRVSVCVQNTSNFVSGNPLTGLLQLYWKFIHTCILIIYWSFARCSFEVSAPLGWWVISPWTYFLIAFFWGIKSHSVTALVWAIAVISLKCCWNCHKTLSNQSYFSNDRSSPVSFFVFTVAVLVFF